MRAIWSGGFWRAVDDLPRVEPRVVYFDARSLDAKSPEAMEAAAIEPDAEDGYRRMELGEQFYYYTRYGTPLAYARALDLAAAHGVGSATGLRVLDFGYGGIGHLRLLASLGADAAAGEVKVNARCAFNPRTLNLPAPLLFGALPFAI